MLSSCTASALASHAFPDFSYKSESSENFHPAVHDCIFHAGLKMQVRVLSILLGAVLLLQSSRVHAHVRLTFPPARFPDYDFLDNVRTGGPCGIPGKCRFVARSTVRAATWNAFCAWDSNLHLPVTSAQLTRPDERVLCCGWLCIAPFFFFSLFFFF